MKPTPQFVLFAYADSITACLSRVFVEVVFALYFLNFGTFQETRDALIVSADRYAIWLVLSYKVGLVT